MAPTRRYIDVYVALSCLSSAWLSLVRGSALCLGVLGVACSSDSADDGGAAAASGGGTGGTGAEAGAGGVPASELPYQPCPAESDVGGFTIELGDGFTSVDGQVFDAVAPAYVSTELQSEAGCRLVTYPNPVCNPPCEASTQDCAPNNQCLPKPVAHDVGSVIVTGLARAVEMTANANTGSYRPPAPALPHPGFAAGADLRVSASGGDYQPFELRGWGVEAFQFTGETVDVSAGTPVSLSWAPPTQAGPARIRAVLDINNHGSSNTSIECDFPDTGSAQIPASLLDALIARGTSGFPTLGITRRTATSTQIEPGCVQLIVTTYSMNSIDVTLPGLVSCNEDNPCPDGLTCKPIERYCE
jgi:hypothetical protein